MNFLVGEKWVLFLYQWKLQYHQNCWLLVSIIKYIWAGVEKLMNLLVSENELTGEFVSGWKKKDYILIRGINKSNSTMKTFGLWSGHLWFTFKCTHFNWGKLTICSILIGLSGGLILLLCILQWASLVVFFDTSLFVSLLLIYSIMK